MADWPLFSMQNVIKCFIYFVHNCCTKLCVSIKVVCLVCLWVWFSHLQCCIIVYSYCTLSNKSVDTRSKDCDDHSLESPSFCPFYRKYAYWKRSDSVYKMFRCSSMYEVQVFQVVSLYLWARYFIPLCNIFRQCLWVSVLKKCRELKTPDDTAPFLETPCCQVIQ